MFFINLFAQFHSVEDIFTADSTSSNFYTIIRKINKGIALDLPFKAVHNKKWLGKYGCVQNWDLKDG